MKRKGLSYIAAFCACLLPLMASCDQRADETQEIILASDNFQPTSLFFIHFLDGMIPIPNRYHLNADSSRPNYDWEFVSPTATSSKHRIAPDQWLTGEITMGGIDRLPTDLQLPSDAPAAKFDCYGLSIEIRNTKIQDVHYVLFLKDKRYLSVFDHNDDLWKAMLLVYGRSTGHQDVCSQINSISPHP